MRSDRRLAALLRASAIYDLVAFALLVWTPPWLLQLFDHPQPSDPFLFRLAALPLALLPVLYFAAARDPLGRPEFVRVAFQLRLLGASIVAVLIVWQQPTAPFAYWCFAVADLGWALGYLATALPAGLRLFGD